MGRQVFSGREQEAFERYVRHCLREGFDQADAVSLAAQRVIKDRRATPTQEQTHD